MSQLQVKTRGNSTPQGKQRVFFCCHRDDFDVFFESVSDEILARQNCAVYYYEPGTAVEPQERELDLGQMQLFVLPVTTRLLTDGAGDNTALRDFDFAASRHIPVLPLMQESGLEELFNCRCGDLQFLDKYAADPTAIGYEEKLTGYLESVLVGDELAEKVRAAFDAYVFLSYRKKDRKYAQELMALIHKNDFCRDIAIWYDEFLTPGENFNDAIRDALQKSQLFALVVTPNLVNEPNYVASVEYPMARAAQMRVLPAKMVDTDEKVLQAMYEGIDKSTDAHDEQALTQALLARLQGIAKAENDADPQHNFFIGLAYLNGIDMEVNHERALQLITSAANAGLPEAMEKLAAMYRTGEGVTHNYHMAVGWMEKLVGVYQTAFAAAPDDHTARPLWSALWNMANYLREMGDTSRAKEIYREVARSVQELATASSSLYARRWLVRCYYVVAENSEWTEKPNYYRLAIPLAEDIAQETGAPYDRNSLAICCHNMALCLHDLIDDYQVQDYFQQALDLLEQLVQESPTEQYLRNLAHLYSSMGCWGVYSDGPDNLKKSIELYRQVAEQTNTVADQRWLVLAYTALSRELRERGQDLPLAEECSKQAQLLEKQIADSADRDTDHIQRKRRQAANCFARAEQLKKAGRSAAAMDVVKKGLALRYEVLQELDTEREWRDFRQLFGKVWPEGLEKNDIAAYRDYYEKWRALCRKVVERLGQPEDWDELFCCYSRYAQWEWEKCYYAMAGLRFEEALAVLDAMPPMPEDYDLNGKRMQILEKIEKMKHAAEQRYRIRRQYEQLLEKYPDSYDDDGSVRHRLELYDQMIAEAEMQNDWQGMAEYYQGKMAFAEGLPSKRWDGTDFLPQTVQLVADTLAADRQKLLFYQQKAADGQK